MRKDSRSFGVPQWIRGILWFVLRQKPIIQECIVSPNAKFAEILRMYAADVVEFLACKQCIVVVPGFRVKHIFV
jgi:hypothetical protein